MASISVDVDIDLRDFDIDELAEELYDRIQSHQQKSYNDEKQLNRLLSLIIALHDQFFGDTEDQHVLPVTSLSDELKSEYLQQVFDKYTLSHIESVLPI